MHVSEGVLSAPVLAAEQLPRAGVLAAAFFVVSLVRIPVGAVSVHLALNGLCGLMLGWGAFPVILVGLTLQAIFFQFGGLTTLGVNLFIMAFPAVLAFYLFRPVIWKSGYRSPLLSFLAGFGTVLLSAVTMGASLYLSGKEFSVIAGIVVVANVPVMVGEGLVTLSAIGFLGKVYPALLFDSDFGAKNSHDSK